MSELGTREHYEEYIQNCNDAGITPESWSLWQYRYPQPVVPVESYERRWQQIEALQAEVARLEAENAALKARNEEQGRDLIYALGRISQLKDIIASK